MSSVSKKKNISFGKIFTVLGIALAVLLPTRLYQLFFLTEADGSGFFTGFDASVVILYAAAVVFTVILLVLVSVTDKVTASKSFRGKNKTLAIGSLLFAVGLAYDVTISASTFIRSVMTYSAGQSMMTYLFSNGMLAVAFEGICGLAACVYFILYGLSYLDGKSTYYEYKFLAIMPLFWSMFRMVHRFMTKISFTMLAELILELVMLAFMMLFFLSFARISSQICQKGEMRKAMKYGTVAALFAILIGVARAVVSVCGKTELLPDGFDFTLADITFGVFAIIYIDACSKTGRDASEDDLIPEEVKEEKEEEIDDDFLEN